MSDNNVIDSIRSTIVWVCILAVQGMVFNFSIFNILVNNSGLYLNEAGSWVVNGIIYDAAVLQMHNIYRISLLLSFVTRTYNHLASGKEYTLKTLFGDVLE